jgi:hypothetical protein
MFAQLSYTCVKIIATKSGSYHSASYTVHGRHIMYELFVKFVISGIHDVP